MTALQLGRMQLKIMQVLWVQGRATAREITDALKANEPVAHSTVQTLLRGLEEKRAVAHRAEGRTFVFFPLVAHDKVKKSATKDLVNRIFGGNAGELVSYLLKHEKITPRELGELKKLIEEKRDT
jgi:BlaI family penicillinase repressor